jgi:hypothetical protein
MTGIFGNPHSAVRRVAGVVSDGTGRSQDEVIVLATIGAAALAAVAVWRGVAWAVQALTDQNPWPTPPGRTRA